MDKRWTSVRTSGHLAVFVRDAHWPPGVGARTVSDTVAGILEREPDWRSLPAHTPARVRWLLRRCLEKDLNRRLHDIADARIELDEALSEPGESSPDTSGDRSTSARRSIGGRAVRVAAGLGLATLIAVLAYRAGFSSRPAPVDAPAYLASIPLPESVNLSTSPSGRFALSPDGRRLAFSGTDKSGRTQLWIRSLDGSVAQPLAGTDGATFPFWSHDSRFVAFLSQGKLKKVEATGGATTTLTDAASNSTGAWSRDDVILFTPKGGEPLYRISASWGHPDSCDDSRRCEWRCAALVPPVPSRRPPFPLLRAGEQERRSHRSACRLCRLARSQRIEQVPARGGLQREVHRRSLAVSEGAHPDGAAIRSRAPGAGGTGGVCRRAGAGPRCR